MTNKDKLPKKVKIFNEVYSIKYVDNPADVDVHKREALFGQVDYWTCIIRVYAGKERTLQSIYHTIWHEMLHAICQVLRLEELRDNEDAIDRLATGISGVLQDNPSLIDPFKSE